MDPSVLSTGLPSLAAVLVLVGNIVMRWLELRDREAHRRAVLALSGNPKALEMLAQTPTAPKDINTGPVILLAVGAAAALMAVPTPQFADAASKRECSTAADCLDGERCEAGKCVSSARRPTQRPKPTHSSHTDEELTLWWAPRGLRRDPYEIMSGY